MRLLTWLLRAALFFVLFAFAINNQHEVHLKWFFGLESRAPMVMVVLVTFAAGCGVGVLAMLPNWWRQRRRARALRAVTPATTAPAAAVTPPPADVELIPRDGL